MQRQMYLIGKEQAQFELLSAELRDGWEVALETGTTYESKQQILMRYRLADFSRYPEMQDFTEKLVSGEDMDSLSIESIPAEVQSEFYFVVGARGVNALMQVLLAEIETDEDIEALAFLSSARHQLLEINASSTHR